MWRSELARTTRQRGEHGGLSCRTKPYSSQMLTPAVYYQITMDSSISEDGAKDNELWVSLGLKYIF